MIQIKRLRPAAYARLLQGGLLAVVLLFNGGRSQAQQAAELPQRLQAITLNATCTTSWLKWR